MGWSWLQLCLLQVWVGSAEYDWPPYPSYAKSEQLRQQYIHEADALTQKCNTFDAGVISIRKMTQDLDGCAERQLADLASCRSSLMVAEADANQWAQACVAPVDALEAYKRSVGQLQEHVVRMDAVLPQNHLQRQKLRTGEDGIVQRLSRLKELISEREAVYTLVQQSLDMLPEKEAPPPAEGQLGLLDELQNLQRRAQLFRAEATYLLDAADAPILARRAVVSARAALLALREPDTLPSDLTQTVWPQVSRSLIEDLVVTEEVAARIDRVWEHELATYAERRQGRAQNMMPADSADRTLWSASLTLLKDLGAESSAEHEEHFVTLLNLSRGVVP
jgi:hypothetical protein